ncbi:hypothetical protein LCGC14_2060850, partial [marine sediment metagenome]
MPEDREELALSSPPLRENVDPNFALDEDQQIVEPDEKKEEEAKSEDKESEKQPSKIQFEIDPEDVNGSLDKLFQEHPEVSNIFSTRVGQKAAAKHQPRIAELEIENQRLALEVTRTQIN